MKTTQKKSLPRRVLKWTGISLLLIILLLIAAPFIFRDKIVALVKEEANKSLNARVDFGDFDLSLISSFPDFRFKITNVSVIGIQEFKDDTLAYIRTLGADINLKSVISGGPYQVNSVIIDGARILGKVLSSGKANWDISKANADSTAKSPADTSVTRFALKLKAFKIKDAFVVYDDLKGGMYAQLENLNYDLSGDFTQDNFVLSNLLDIARTTFKMSGVSYLSGVHTRLKMDVDMDMPHMKFTFKENEFSLNDLSLGFEGFVAMPDTNIAMDLKFNAKKTEFKSILSLVPGVYSKDFASVQTSGQLALDGYFKGTYNAVQMPAFGINLAITNAMFRYPSLPKSVNHINLSVKVLNPNGVLDATTVDVHQFHVEMAGNPIDITAHIKTPISDPGIKAELKGLIDLASVKDIVPLDKGDNLSGIIKSDISIDGHMSAIEKKEYEKFKASGALEIDKMNYKSAGLTYEVLLNTLKLNFTTQFVELAAFDAKMGKSDLQAKGKIENFMQYLFRDDLIKGSFAVTGRLMDLNELMSTSPGAAPASVTAAASGSAAAAGAAAASPVIVPSNIDFNLDCSISKVLYTNLTLDNVVGNVVVRHQKVEMTNLTMNTLGGKLTINGYYETADPKKPGVGLNLKAENFDIQGTFKAFNTIQKLAPAGQYAKGMFTATLENFKTVLDQNMEPDLNSVNATGVFKTNQVNVGGFPPFVKLGEALKIDQLKNIEVSNISLNYFIKDGRLNIQPFETKINSVATTISGSTGLDQTIDYKWKLAVPRSMFGSAANSALTGLLSQANAAAGTNVTLGEKINITALFGGTVMKPTVKTSLKDEPAGAVATITAQALNAGIDKASAEAQKILDDARVQVDKIKAETQALVDKTRQDEYTQADQLVQQASNPLAKAGAKKAAEIAKKKTDEKTQKILDDSNARCQKILDDAKVRSDAKAAESKK